MNPDLYNLSREPIELLPGWPKHAKVQPLPQAQTFWMQREFGSILFQEIKTEQYLLRYFIFRFLKQMTLLSKERGEGIQSLIALKGRIAQSLKGQKSFTINEGQFMLFDSGSTETQTIFPGGKECHLLNAYYPTNAYTEFLPLFPSLKRDLKKALKKPFFFLPFPRPARHSILDATHEILFDTYKPQLQQFYWNLKIKQILFTQLAQTYTEAREKISTSFEKEMAESARLIIEADISKHYSNEELAKVMNCSESSLKRAFHQEFGLGLFEYLRKLRMHKARELLLQGEQVKTVAPTVGMRPTNFTMEFQKYFGYKATSLKRVKK